MLDLVARLEQHFGHGIAVNHRPARAFDLPANVLDSTLAGHELGWSPQTPLAKGVERTRRWLAFAKVNAQT